MLELISYFNFVLALTISAAYFYQLVYLMYGLVSLRKPWIFVAQKQHRYAVMISARNEEEVIVDPKRLINLVPSPSQEPVQGPDLSM